MFLMMTAPRRVSRRLMKMMCENHHFPIRQGYPAVKTVNRTAVEAGCYFLLGPEVDREGPSRAHVLSRQGLCLTSLCQRRRQCQCQQRQRRAPEGIHTFEKMFAERTVETGN